MKITVYAKAWVVLKAESISEGVQLGVLQEQLLSIGMNVKVLGGDTIELPIVNPHPENTVEKKLKSAKKNLSKDG